MLTAKQFKLALLAVGFLMVVNLSFPPWVSLYQSTSRKITKDFGYRFILTSPDDDWARHTAQINYSKLGLQSVIILVIGCGVYFGLRPSKPNKLEDEAELEGGNRDEGLWAKCFAECDGDENKAKALYLRTRVGRLEGSDTEPQLIEADPEKSETQTENDISPEPISESEPWQPPVVYNTVGGWLLFFCISLTFCTPAGICSTTQHVSLEFAAMQTHNPGCMTWLPPSELQTYISLVIYTNAALAIFSIVCGCGLWARRQWALKWTKVYLCASLILVLVDWAFLGYLDALPAMRDFIVANGHPAGEPLSYSNEVITNIIRTVVYSVIWYLYLLKSSRVRQTKWETHRWSRLWRSW